MTIKDSQVVLFEKRKVRRVLIEEQWWFVIIDVIEILTDSVNPKDYLNKMRRRDKELNKGYGQIVHPLLVETSGGRQRLSCVNTEGILRIIQSIPSPKAEPFKRWLARIGKERIDEINDPELAMNRMRALYEKKGYPKDWIDKRVRGIAVRQGLTQEWQNWGIDKSLEFAILTNEIMRGTFDLEVEDYKANERRSGWWCRCGENQKRH
ncbi:MAG: Bro-N domain-containing protein [Patescibacteria group bacterium]|jgi:DNA-damage-inducible protein D